MKNCFVIILFFLILQSCINSNTSENHFEIIFWKYNSELNFEMLGNNLEEIEKHFEKYFSMTLDDFEYYLWDDQILCMKYDIYENKYKEKEMQLYKESDYGSIFFTLLIDNKVLIHGLNRMLPQTAQMQPYDETNNIRIFSWIQNKENVYFIITYKRVLLIPAQIFSETEQYKDKEILYIKKMKNNLTNKKIIYGKHNLEYLFNTGILEKQN